ncbi:Ldh family oxidoreductase [Gemmobacter denitrificans]|uniref:Ldh family oxidoreductase n=1 Tax=Gemmobacter denitrificans TaxID=3123040 RepID=A0ABU8BV38_9RHOB
MQHYPQSDLIALAERACLACGAGADMAQSLARASVSACRAGRQEVGLAHLIDHLHSLREGRIRGAAQPRIDSPAPALMRIDADGGVAQHGFDLAFAELAQRAQDFGLALLVQRNCYPAGELGYFVRRLAESGLIGLAAGNAHALMAVAAGGGKAFSTNPLAFAAPLPADRPPLVIDQASSATAFVNILRAAAAGQNLPEGWAQDVHRRPTTDPTAAITGALLPFGGYKGANIALMVEVLAAGLTGGRWSLDTGHFLTGHEPPGSGMVVLALSPGLCAPDFPGRLSAQLDRLAALGLHVPGQRQARPEAVPVDPKVIDELTRLAGG